jgi:hypothetical protein
MSGDPAVGSLTVTSEYLHFLGEDVVGMAWCNAVDHEHLAAIPLRDVYAGSLVMSRW